MAISPLRTLRFRVLFAISWWCWSVLHMMVLRRLGFSWTASVADSLVSNLLLAGAVLLVTLTLQFYVPQKNRYGYILALCVVLSCIWLLASRLLLMWLMKEIPGYDVFYFRSGLIRFAVGFLLTGCMSLISVLWYTLQDQQEAEQRKTEAEKLSKEAELFKLRQQLQPHFLFNSLNSINALIISQPQQARNMVQQLSDFLRGTLKKEDNQWVALEEELQQLRLYLDIEKVRFGHRLETVFSNEVPPGTMVLPAMLLQPVVENAIKFGLYDTTGPITIRLEAKQVDHELLLSVANPFDPETSLPRKGTGFGLRSVERRLYLLFARSDLLQTEQQGNQFITLLKIPQP